MWQSYCYHRTWKGALRCANTRAQEEYTTFAVRKVRKVNPKYKHSKWHVSRAGKALA